MGSSQLMIVLRREANIPLQQQVSEQITASVRSGRLRPGENVPASRELAQQLGVSRTVVLRAYELLRATGVLTSRRGSGTWVSRITVEVPGGSRRSTGIVLDPEPPRAVGATGTLWQPWEPAPMYRPGSMLDFRHGTPALGRFPVARWRQSVNDAYARADIAALGYGPAEGSSALRVEIATLLRQSRALDVSPDRILVSSGATQAMDILARMLLAPGDVAVIEDPSHTVLRQIFGCSTAAVVPVPVDADGLRVGDIDDQVRAYGHDPARVRLVYVTPSHQFPTGVIMSPDRRRELLAWSNRRGAVVLEDDYHNEFTGTAHRLPALAAHRPAGDVAYVGSFSKTLFPSLRIGYAVLPAALVQPFLGIKWITDRLTPTVTQDALAEFIGSGSYGRHVARMDRLYRQRRIRLLEALEEHFGSGVRISGEAAGLHVLVSLGGVTDGPAGPAVAEVETAARAAAAGVQIYPASGYFVGRPPEHPTFLMGYAALTPEQITEGVRRLASAVRPLPAR